MRANHHPSDSVEMAVLSLKYLTFVIIYPLLIIIKLTLDLTYYNTRNIMYL